MEQFEPQKSSEKLKFTQEIADQVEEWLWDFQERFPLDKLSAITTVEEGQTSELRQVAREVQRSLSDFISDVLSKYDIPENVANNIKMREARIRRAVGRVNATQGTISHD